MLNSGEATSHEHGILYITYSLYASEAVNDKIKWRVTLELLHVAGVALSVRVRVEDLAAGAACAARTGDLLDRGG